MSLKIKRGTNSQRLTVVPAEGELVYATDIKKLFIGDGTTTGGNIVGLSLAGTIEDDVYLGTHHLYGSNNLNLDGNNGNITANNIFADFRGSLFGDDSTIIVNSTNGNISASTITAASGIYGDVTGSIFSNNSNLTIDGATQKAYLTSAEIDEISGLNSNDVRMGYNKKTRLVLFSSSHTPGGQLQTWKLHHNGSSIDALTFVRSRGTNDFPTALISGDQLMKFYISGYDGNSYPGNQGEITAYVDGTVTTGTIPVTLKFSTAGVNRSLASTVEMRSNGDTAINSLIALGSSITIKSGISLNSYMNLAVYETPTARDTAILSPTEGMMIYLQDDFTSSGTPKVPKAQIYCGNPTNAWVNLF